MSVWGKCDMFKVVIDINDSFLKIPREGDKWIMQMFVQAGFNKEDFLRMNRVRVHQQVLFYLVCWELQGNLWIRSTQPKGSRSKSGPR